MPIRSKDIYMARMEGRPYAHCASVCRSIDHIYFTSKEVWLTNSWKKLCIGTLVDACPVWHRSLRTVWVISYSIHLFAQN